MNTVDLVTKAATGFYNVLQQDKNGRYKSWEHCYSTFYEARKETNPDVDYLSLMLAFYLASWGMYRGSSFLLQKDYKIHVPIVKELLKPKYDCLVDIKCVDFRDQKIQELVFHDLQLFFKDYYKDVRSSVAEKETKRGVSDTLITKILMGTLACVPAYDRYFISGIKETKVSTGNYNINSILRLADFYETNQEKLEATRRTLKVGVHDYPQMKMIDMGFWQIGFELDLNRGLKKAH